MLNVPCKTHIVHLQPTAAQEDICQDKSVFLAAEFIIGCRNCFTFSNKKNVCCSSALCGLFILLNLIIKWLFCFWKAYWRNMPNHHILIWTGVCSLITLQDVCAVLFCVCFLNQRALLCVRVSQPCEKIYICAF